MELIIHYIYAVAISKSDPDWNSYTPFQLSMLGYFNLHHIWLKLLILWRFFRLWALLDDMDPPENMARCMSNNYSALAFWRGWHRSYNRWIIRYLYVPLGGSGQPGTFGVLRSIFNYVLVFMFVAIWHDINLRLLTWGWLITVFLLPEIAATLLFPAKKWKDQPNTYRALCGIGAIGNILMMMMANLVGYAIGIDGLKGLLLGILGSTTGLALFAAVCGCLFIGVQIMFEVREEEKRAGIKMPS
jgi:protein-cysteine N-palmitoyltransferase HHAT